MSGFSVDPEVVRDAGSDMLKLSEGIGLAKTHLDTYARVSETNALEGNILGTIGSRVNGIRDRLTDDYAPGGRAHRPYHDSGEALKSTADAYEQTDAATAARVDGTMPGSEISAPPEEVNAYPPSIDLSTYGDLLPEPEDGVPGFNTYKEIAEGLSFLFGLKWVTSTLTVIGLVDPLRPLKDDLKGDWKAVGKAVTAVSQLGDFWTEMASDTQRVPNRFSYVMLRGNPTPPTGAYPWDGNAADAANDYLIDLARHSSEHGFQLSHKATAITCEAVVLADLLDQVIGLVEDLIALMPGGKTVDEFVEDLLSPYKNLDRMRRIAGQVAKIVTAVRLTIDAALVIVALFSELAAAGHVDYPQVAAYTEPDVDG